MTLEEAASKYKIRGIPSNLVDRFWPLAAPYVKRALDHTRNEFLPEDIKAYCKDKVIQLWLVSEGERVVAAATTEIIVYPQAKHCRVVTLGGSKAVEWTELLLSVVLNDWAKEQGCTAMEAFVRRGYVKILADYGYKHMYSAVFRDVE